MRGSARWAVPVTAAALAFGGLAVAVAPSAAACGGYGEPACQTFVLSFSANGGVCSPSSVSATENTWATLLSASQCTRSGFTLSFWETGSGTRFAPEAEVFVTGNNGFTAVWTLTTPTSSPGTPTGGTGTPTEPTESPNATPTSTVSIPPGQTNPDRRTVAAPGVIVVPQRVADNVAPSLRGSASPSSLAVGLAGPVIRGTVLLTSVRVLGVNTVHRVKLTSPSGDVVDFGSLSSNSAARITLPAIRYSRPGTYVWAMSPLLESGATQTLYTAFKVT